MTGVDWFALGLGIGFFLGVFVANGGSLRLPDRRRGP